MTGTDAGCQLEIHSGVSKRRADTSAAGIHVDALSSGSISSIPWLIATGGEQEQISLVVAAAAAHLELL